MSFGGNLIWATTIQNRRQYERWRRRSEAKAWFVIKCYLIWSVVFAIWGGVVTYVNPPGSPATHPSSVLEHALLSGVIGLACFGPLALIGCLVLLTSGLTRFRETQSSLIQQKRICEACTAVAFYDGDKIHADHSKGHTAADLVPRMNKIEEDGQAHILCDQCLAEVSAIDSGE